MGCLDARAIVGVLFFFFQAEDGIRDVAVTGVQTCALPILPDPLAEVRAEFAAGLDKRIDAMQAALGRLQHEFRVEDAQALYQAAHALTEIGRASCRERV